MSKNVARIYSLKVTGAEIAKICAALIAAGNTALAEKILNRAVQGYRRGGRK